MKALLLAGAMLASGAAGATPALMPLPASVAVSAGALAIAGPFAPRWSGCGDARRLDAAAARLQADIGRQTGLAFDAGAAVPLAVYFISGRWFVRGIAAGAVKG